MGKCRLLNYIYEKRYVFLNKFLEARTTGEAEAGDVPYGVPRRPQAVRCQLWCCQRKMQ